MRKALVFIVAALLSSAVRGGEITLNWTAPTIDIKGNPIIGELVYIADWDCGYTVGSVEVIGKTSHTMNIIGNCFFWIRARNEKGATSEESEIVSKTIFPGGATNVRVTTEN